MKAPPLCTAAQCADQLMDFLDAGADEILLQFLAQGYGAADDGVEARAGGEGL